MTDDLVKRLHWHRDFIGTNPWPDGYPFLREVRDRLGDAADRIEALTAERDGLLRCVTDNHVALCRAEKAEAERDGYRKALERIAGVKGPYSHPFPESNEGYGSFAIVTAREALKGEKA